MKHVSQRLCKFKLHLVRLSLATPGPPWGAHTGETHKFSTWRLAMKALDTVEYGNLIRDAVGCYGYIGANGPVVVHRDTARNSRGMAMYSDCACDQLFFEQHGHHPTGAIGSRNCAATPKCDGTAPHAGSRR